MTEVPGKTAVIWLDGPSFAESFFRFYAYAQEIFYFLRVFHDWPVISGLISMYHSVSFSSVFFISCAYICNPVYVYTSALHTAVLDTCFFIYFQSGYYAPDWLVRAYRSCCEFTKRPLNIQPPRPTNGRIIEPIPGDQLLSFVSGISSTDTIIKSEHRLLIWSIMERGSPFQSLPSTAEMTARMLSV